MVNTMIVLDIDGEEGDALLDALLYSDYDERLTRIYHHLGLTPDDNNMMVVFE